MYHGIFFNSSYIYIPIILAWISISNAQTNKEHNSMHAWFNTMPASDADWTDDDAVTTMPLMHRPEPAAQHCSAAISSSDTCDGDDNYDYLSQRKNNYSSPCIKWQTSTKSLGLRSTLSTASTDAPIRMRNFTTSTRPSLHATISAVVPS